MSVTVTSTVTESTTETETITASPPVVARVRTNSNFLLALDLRTINPLPCYETTRANTAAPGFSQFIGDLANTPGFFPSETSCPAPTP